MSHRRAFLRMLAGTAGCWLAGRPLLRAAAVPASPAGSLRRAAAAWDGRWQWVERGKVGRLRGASGRVAEFTVEKRDCLIDGTRVWLGGAVVATGDDLQVLPSDLTETLAPLLAGGDERRPWRTLAIDPGHGGRDNGTENTEFRWREKTFVLDLADRLERRMRAAGRNVVRTRTDDTFVPLEERPARAAAAGADLFVSLHLNAGPAPVTGVETFILPPPGQPSTGRAEVTEGDHEVLPGHAHGRDNLLLGFALQDRLRRGTGSNDRGLRRARFAVLRTLACPGALVEAGFLSNREEGRRLADPDYRERLAGWLAEGLAAYTVGGRNG